MFVVIDTETLQFLDIRHPDLGVCCNLCAIELDDDAEYGIYSMDECFLRGMDEIDQIILYKNTTGEDVKFIGEKLRNVLFKLAERIPVRECNPIKVDQQAEWLESNRKEFTHYKYNHRGSLPIIVDELFPKPAKMAKSENEAEEGLTPPPPKKVIVFDFVKPAEPEPPKPVSNRQSGVRDIIHSVATQAWEAAGCPTDTKVILQLRKELMPILESEHGVKRTTSSNELGNWMKQILAK